MGTVSIRHGVPAVFLVHLYGCCPPQHSGTDFVAREELSSRCLCPSPLMKAPYCWIPRLCNSKDAVALSACGLCFQWQSSACACCCTCMPLRVGQPRSHQYEQRCPTQLSYLCASICNLRTSMAQSSSFVLCWQNLGPKVTCHQSGAWVRRQCVWCSTQRWLEDSVHHRHTDSLNRCLRHL